MPVVRFLSLFLLSLSCGSPCTGKVEWDMSADYETPPCPDADESGIVDETGYYYAECSWDCVHYEGECVSVYAKVGWMDGWFMPQVETDDCK